HRRRHAARLIRDVGGQREELVRLAFERLCPLVASAARVDARLEVDDLSRRPIEGGIVCRDTAHRRGGVAVARRAALAIRAVAPGPFAAFHPEKGWIGDIVRLHRTHIGAGELEAGAQCVERQGALLRRREGRGERCGGQHNRPAHHQTTLTSARASPRTPASSTHSNSSAPDSRAVTKKRKYGLAAMPEVTRTAKTGAPL